MTRALPRYAFLDRDGTIIVDKHYLGAPDAIEFLPGALEGMRLLRDSGFRLVLVTNQSGIARGYFSEAELSAVHARLEEMLEAEGLAFEAIYVCPHGPDEGCGCRKPAPGMLLQAMRDLTFGSEQAILIGDSEADLGAAANAGIAGFRVPLTPAADGRAASNLSEAAKRAIAHLAAKETGRSPCM